MTPTDKSVSRMTDAELQRQIQPQIQHWIAEGERRVHGEIAERDIAHICSVIADGDVTPLLIANLRLAIDLWERHEPTLENVERSDPARSHGHEGGSAPQVHLRVHTSDQV